MSRRNLIAIFLLFFVIGSVYGLSQIFRKLNSSVTTAQTATKTLPIAKYQLIRFTDLKKTFTFLYPSTWHAEPLTIDNHAQTTNFTICNTTVMSVTQVSSLDPKTKRLLSAEKYLNIPIGQIKPSKIEDRRALVVSTAATSSAIIEATDSAQIIEFQFHPSCREDLETGKQNLFFPLLSFFKFL